MVFEPGAAPAKRPAFLDWYDEQTEWGDDRAYDDPAVSAPALQAFYADMVAAFPVMPPAASASERDSEQESEQNSGTDYTIGPSLIYMSFLDWDRIDQAHETVVRLAARHALGFFDVSSDLAEVWLPDNKGGLRIAHSD